MIDIDVDSFANKCDGVMTDIIRSGSADFNYEMDRT
jgi:hypothetical protein